MPNYSVSSKSNLSTCHLQLQRIFSEVILHIDHSILYGHRTLEIQKQLFTDNKTKTLNSKHLHSPSLAVDVAPYPLDWELLNRYSGALTKEYYSKHLDAFNREIQKYYFLSGFVFSVAANLNIPIRWGGAWKRMYVLNAVGDFQDLGHYELLTGEEQYVQGDFFLGETK